MNRSESLQDLLVSADEFLPLLEDIIQAAAFPRKFKEHHLSWLTDIASPNASSLVTQLQVYRRFPSEPVDSAQPKDSPLWYWCVGTTGWLHELHHHPNFATVVSSRQSHRSEDRQRWFRKFLHAARSIDRADDWWLIFPSIATGPLSEHVARRCDVKSIKCDIVSWAFLLEQLAKLAQQPVSHSPEFRRIQCWITPALDKLQDTLIPESLTSNIKHACVPKNLHDVLSITLPQRVHVIDMREGGTIDHLLMERLTQTSSHEAAVRIYRLIDENSNSQQAHLSQGAIDWLIVPQVEHSTEQSVDWGQIEHSIYNPIFDVSVLLNGNTPAEWSYLTHCTRARLFEWSDSSLSAEWDRWLLDGLPEETSPWETLLQIARSQRLLASPEMTRDKIATISFSAVPLQELLSRRTYRSHLRRWDWEPYGVCIRKAALEKLAAREVIYGDDETWRRLSPTDRPWFQPRYSRNGKLDWQVEKEWRILGDLRLRKLPWESLFFFVPTMREAQRLSGLSAWPVAVIGSNSIEKSPRLSPDI